MRLLLDTNAYSRLLRGVPETTVHVRKAERILMSTIVVGELIFGFRYGSRYAQNMQQLNAFLQEPHVDLLPVTLVTADRFGYLANALRSKGTPIPSNDLWIAAHAVEHAAGLLSYDAHFADVEDVLWIHPER